MDQVAPVLAKYRTNATQSHGLHVQTFDCVHQSEKVTAALCYDKCAFSAVAMMSISKTVYFTILHGENC